MNFLIYYFTRGVPIIISAPPLTCLWVEDGLRKAAALYLLTSGLAGKFGCKNLVFGVKYPPTYAKIVAQKDGFDSSQRGVRRLLAYTDAMFF